MDEVDALFKRCNVVVTTSALAGGCSDEVQARMAEVCTHLVIDEAHHAEAPTWKEFKRVFKAHKRPILQFTATPFREDADRPGRSVQTAPAVDSLHPWGLNGCRYASERGEPTGRSATPSPGTHRPSSHSINDTREASQLSDLSPHHGAVHVVEFPG